MIKKEDRRTQYTKMVLKESLLDLLKTKHINQISVAELCRLADINRNTFYNHYTSPFEILNELETELFFKLSNTIKDIDDLQEIILKACRFYANEQKISELVFMNKNGVTVLAKVLKVYKEKRYNGIITSYPNHLVPLMEKVYKYAEKGTIALFENWLVEGCKESPETIANLVYKLLMSSFQVMENMKLMHKEKAD